MEVLKKNRDGFRFRLFVRTVENLAQPKFLNGMEKNPDPNDWARGADGEVRRQIAEFVVATSEYFEREARRFGLPYFERTADFQEDLKRMSAALGEPKGDKSRLG